MASKFYFPIILFILFLQTTIGNSTRADNEVTLPNLPYAYNALEPIISEKIMTLHHDKHHRGYVAKFNTALEEMSEATKSKDLAAISRIAKSLKFNGGGHINHSLFWESLSPISSLGGVLPSESSKLLKAINNVWGTIENFKTEFNKVASGIEGSGWCWLAYVPSTQSLIITETSNQDTLYPLNLIPLYGLDVWEHAYYIDYQNLRPKYIEEMWKIVNWKEIDSRFEKALLPKKNKFKI